MKNSIIQPKIIYKDNLPVVERKKDIIKAICDHQVIVVAGETGSGKTTQLPVICLEAGRGRRGKIGCTQPRRIAAISISEYIARQLESVHGQEVGYKIRFNAVESPGTCIKFMTDGILLAEMRHDPLLRMYDTLIIDEAHERSLNIDFILGYLRQILPRRPDLKVIISSATIDTTLFSKSFADAPVIEVSGRVFPVEVFYRDFNNEDAEELGYIDETIEAVKDLYVLDDSGDILIFLPTERDIRETCNRLEGLRLPHTSILPLFSRLSRKDQIRIFKDLDCRKIVVATNIAETSVTVPGIRFVVDSGLARISEYAPRLRTNRLPITRISKASADQRKGRCGRVMDGICIRLYSQDDFFNRDPFTLPEIKRCNLAGVILTMIAHRLGDIETFPFLESPSKQAISEGYAQLRELGAINHDKKLTPIGKQISRFPLDPHIARMIIAARDESALREVKIIAAALSIVDPRERPFEKRTEADAMHKRFIVPGSDPLTFVRLWDTYQDEWRSIRTQNGIRKFCREHFLSYTRMREWHDVHQLIHEELNRMKGFVENSNPASADAVHRALLCGLLSNCAMKNEKGKYRAARGREVVIFPGSTLSGQTPEWIASHEIVETSQCFVRGVFPIQPSWLEQLAAHLCSRNYGEPWFDKKTGFVRVTERITLFGLPVAEHHGVHYGNIDPIKAADVFIRQGLVEEQLECREGFYKHNRALRLEIEKVESKLRSRIYYAGDDIVYDFYCDKLGVVTSLKDLTTQIRKRGSDRFLYMNEDDICAQPLPELEEHYPDYVSVGDKKLPLQYAFNPGAAHDGVTLQLAQDEISYISSASAGWVLPALWPKKVADLLRNCPKAVRKKFMPIDETANDLASQLTVSHEPFEKVLSDLIRKRFGVSIDFNKSAQERYSSHLSLKVQVHDDQGNIIKQGTAEEILSSTSDQQNSVSGWSECCRRYEQRGLTKWSCGDVPQHIELILQEKGLPLFGYPALTVSTKGEADLIVFRTLDEAAEAHPGGVRKLLEIALVSEFAWMEKELKMSQQQKLLCAPLGGFEVIRKHLLDILKNHVLSVKMPVPRTSEAFYRLVDKKKECMKGIGYEIVDVFESTMTAYNLNCKALVKTPVKYREILKKDLTSYIDDLLNQTVMFDCFRNFPRYMRAIGLRIERLNADPLRYQQKYEQLHFYKEKYGELQNGKSGKNYSVEKLAQLRMMIEEFSISLFAQQEIKTLFPISPKRLDKMIEGFD